MKICIKCKKEKTFDCFQKSKVGKNGVGSYCKLCHNLLAKLSQEKSKTTKKGHISKILATRKAFAKKQNIPFELDVDYLLSIAVDKCPILNIDLSWCEKTKHPIANSPSIDKFVPELGYVKGNVAWISHKANSLKSDGTLEQFKLLVHWMENQ